MCKITNLVKEAFGKIRIDRVKQSDAKAWLIKMQKDGRGYSTIHSVRGVVRPAFEMALQDDLIRKNPFQFELATVVVNDSVTRESITRAQERAFLKFIQEDKHFSKYYDGIYILFNTGLRVSEFCGLTIVGLRIEKRKQLNVLSMAVAETVLLLFLGVCMTEMGWTEFVVLFSVYLVFNGTSLIAIPSAVARNCGIGAVCLGAALFFFGRSFGTAAAVWIGMNLILNGAERIIMSAMGGKKRMIN